MNESEIRKYVTPYSFAVADSLMGARLASPWQRAGALLVDLLAVSLLTLMSASVLSTLLFVISLKAMSALRGQKGATLKRYLLGMVAGASLIFTVSSVLMYVYQQEDEAAQAEADPVALLEYVDESFFPDYHLVISELLGDDQTPVCPEAAQCDTAFFAQLLESLAQDGRDVEDAEKIFNGVLAFLAENKRLDGKAKEYQFVEFLYQNQLSIQQRAEQKASELPSIVVWVKSLATDLGLSFGWAAVYFSALIAWWNGQTLGKRLFRLQVVKIDGSELDLWESFGRYGGYSAGLATGLIGFFQVFWDSNRQAIQDKISETLVIDLSRNQTVNNAAEPRPSTTSE